MRQRREDYTLFKRKGKKVYYFYYRDAYGKRIAKSTGNNVKDQAKEEAERFLAEMADDKKPQAPPVPTLKQ